MTRDDDLHNLLAALFEDSPSNAQSTADILNAQRGRKKNTLAGVLRDQLETAEGSEVTPEPTGPVAATDPSQGHGRPEPAPTHDHAGQPYTDPNDLHAYFNEAVDNLRRRQGKLNFGENNDG